MIVVPIGSYFLTVNTVFRGISFYPDVSSSRLITNRKLFSGWWLGCCLGQCRPCGIHYCSYERGSVGQTKAREQEGQVDTASYIKLIHSFINFYPAKEGSHGQPSQLFSRVIFITMPR